MSKGKLLLLIFLAIVAGLIAERVIAWLFRKLKNEIIAAHSTTLLGILKILYTRLSFDVLGLVGFLMASGVVLGNSFEADSTGFLFATIFPVTIVAIWLAYVVCRFFFAPRRPDLRICKTSDQRALDLTISFSLLAGYMLELVMIALFAYVKWELVSVFVGRWLAREGGDPDDHGSEPGGGDAGGVGLSRVATLLPIVRRTAQFTIVVVSIIMILNNWGVNIGPLLAGAGVIGLAIGFGAQTLVKDIVSGLFFLADDAFRVGEYIDVDGTMGNLEKISLRSLRLRHHRGWYTQFPTAKYRS